MSQGNHVARSVLYIYVCVGVGVYVCIWVCVCVYIYVYICVYIRVYICVCVYIYIYNVLVVRHVFNSSPDLNLFEISKSNHFWYTVKSGYLIRLFFHKFLQSLTKFLSLKIIPESLCLIYLKKKV